MEILPIIGQARPAGGAADQGSEDQSGIFASFLPGGEESAGSGVGGSNLLPPGTIPEVLEGDQEASPPPSPALQLAANLAEQRDAESATGPDSNPDPFAALRETITQAPQPAGPESKPSTDPLGRTGSEIPRSQPTGRAPEAASLPAEAEELPSERRWQDLPRVAPAERGLEPWRGPGGGNGTPLEAQIQAGQQEVGRAISADRRGRAGRDVQGEGPRSDSADRPQNAEQSSRPSNEALLGSASRGGHGGANRAAASQGPAPSTAGAQSFAAPPDLAGAATPASFGFLGTAATPENANFGAALDNAMGKPGASTAQQSEVLAIRIQKAVQAGQDRISLRLHPAELGRIDVQLDIAEDGRLRAAIVAERSEALDLLQRDARLLERALQDAGLKTDSGSFTFDLRDQSAHDQALSGGEADRQHAGPSDGAEELDEIPVHSRHGGHDGLLDLTV